MKSHFAERGEKNKFESSLCNLFVPFIPFVFCRIPGFSSPRRKTSELDFQAIQWKQDKLFLLLLLIIIINKQNNLTNFPPSYRHSELSINTFDLHVYYRERSCSEERWKVTERKSITPETTLCWEPLHGRERQWSMLRVCVCLLMVTNMTTAK